MVGGWPNESRPEFTRRSAGGCPERCFGSMFGAGCRTWANVRCRPCRPSVAPCAQDARINCRSGDGRRTIRASSASQARATEEIRASASRSLCHHHGQPGRKRSMIWFCERRRETSIAPITIAVATARTANPRSRHAAVSARPRCTGIARAWCPSRWGGCVDGLLGRWRTLPWRRCMIHRAVQGECPASPLALPRHSRADHALLAQSRPLRVSVARSGSRSPS
jgi:hypothetical protein